jgi:hypothetical protein
MNENDNNNDDIGIPRESFIRLGRYLYESQMEIDHSLMEEKELLMNTIQEFKIKRNEIQTIIAKTGVNPELIRDLESIYESIQYLEMKI